MTQSKTMDSTNLDQTPDSDETPSTPQEGAGINPEPHMAGAGDSPSLETLRAQAAKATEYWDKLLRATAEMENFKKRVARERGEAAKYASAPLLQALLPVLDNMDMALAAMENAGPADDKGGADTNANANANANTASLRQGVSMVFQQLKSVLAETGLEVIDATGQPFDPQWHEAISQAPTDEAPEGHVLHQTRKGYKLKDRLLRPASVVVAASPAQETSPDS